MQVVPFVLHGKGMFPCHTKKCDRCAIIDCTVRGCLACNTEGLCILSFLAKPFILTQCNWPSNIAWFSKRVDYNIAGGIKHYIIMCKQVHIVFPPAILYLTKCTCTPNMYKWHTNKKVWPLCHHRLYSPRMSSMQHWRSLHFIVLSQTLHSYPVQLAF